jgi:hypothetical protein
MTFTSNTVPMSGNRATHSLLVKIRLAIGLTIWASGLAVGISDLRNFVVTAWKDRAVAVEHRDRTSVRLTSFHSSVRTP